MNFQSVYIVTYGRSGSTLLQGVLNTIPGCVVRGENYNFVHGLYQAWSALRRTHREFADGAVRKPENAWFGAHQFDPQRFLTDARDMVRTQLLGSDASSAACVGFKEIRYTAGALGVPMHEYATRLGDYLDFLAALMPRAAFIFLTRDHSQVCRSAWWKQQDAAAVKAVLTAFEHAAQGYRAAHPEQCFALDYADLTTGSRALEKLHAFLGAPLDAAAVDEVMHREHSFGNSSLPAHARSDLFERLLPMPDRLRRVQPDPLPPRYPQGRSMRWNGVVVAANGETGGRLQLKLSGGEALPVEWGLASPRIASEMPTVAGAGHARYRTPEFELAAGEHCELQYLQGSDAWTLARLERRPI